MVTHVLLPGTCLPRRADATEVVGAALVAKAAGAGFRRIAAELDRSPSTVRRWLRAARDRAHLERLRGHGVRQVAAFDPELVGRVHPARGPLAEALTALAAAVEAVRRRLPTFTAPNWALINVITRGRLLAGPFTT